MANAWKLEHKIVKEAVVGGHVADHDAQMIVRISRGRETFQYLRALLYARDELRDEFFIVAVQRHMDDGGHCKPRLGTVEQHRVAGDHAGLFQRIHPPPARRWRHADPSGELLIALPAVFLQLREKPLIPCIEHVASPSKSADLSTKTPGCG